MSKNSIRQEKSFEMLDGTVVKLKPANLKTVRKLMSTMKKIDENADMTEETITAMVEAAGIIIAPYDKELGEDEERIEEILDMQTFNELVAHAMGSDPNG